MGGDGNVLRLEARGSVMLERFEGEHIARRARAKRKRVMASFFSHVRESQCCGLKGEFVKTESDESRASVVLPRGIRALAIATGFFVTATLFAALLPASLLALMLIVGGAVQPWSQRAGKWLLIAGAFSVTVICVPSVAIGSLHLHNLAPYDFDTIALPLFFLILAILIAWCDVWLILNWIKSRRCRELPGKEDVLHPLIFFVWLSAAGASAFFIPVSVQECILNHAGGDFFDLTFLVLPSLALAVLDVALLTQGIKELRTYLSERRRTAA